MCTPSLANINVLRVCDLKLFLQIMHYISVRVHNLGILGKHKVGCESGLKCAQFLFFEVSFS